MKSKEELHIFWKDPDKNNLPRGYAKPKSNDRTVFLLKLLKNFVKNYDSKILEIGCNAGRNLAYLNKNNYHNLSGIEISKKALDVMDELFPELKQNTKIYNSSVEEKIKNFDDNEFDLVFTMAVLEHIHSDSEWIFKEMNRISKNFLILIEDELNESWRHFPRNYKNIFESMGMNQIFEWNCEDVDGLGEKFFARVFSKK